MAIFETTGTRNEEEAEPLQTGSSRGRFAAGTPEDVAALYTWANIQGARYRDFSGSRVRHREQVRARAAEALRERARGGAEEELVEAARATFAESDVWLTDVPGESGAGGGREVFASVPAGSNSHEFAAMAGHTRGVPEAYAQRARREELASAVPRSFREELEMRLRHSREQESERAGFGESHSGSMQSGRVRVAEMTDTRTRISPRATVGAAQAARESSAGPMRGGERPWGNEGWPSRETGSVRAHSAVPDESVDRWERVDDGPGLSAAVEMPRGSVAPLPLERAEEPLRRESSATVRAWGGLPESSFGEDTGAEQFVGPAWLYERDHSMPRSRTVPAAPRYSDNEPQEEPEHRTRGRWAALRGVQEEGRGGTRMMQSGLPGDRRAPLLVVMSLAGGVGKTSLVATLGRVLSASGERVALGDAASYSMLPFYFGARDVRPGAKRMFAPPEGSHDAPIFVANYDLRRSGDLQEQRHMVAEVLRNGSECNRILLDLPASTEWLVGRMATLGSTMLVPLLPDMNSVIGVEAVERYFERMVDSEGRRVLPFYLLNQFDGALALHQDVREVLRERVGERLLSFVVRRSLLVSEALAEGMTVVDYAPESPVARDYFDLAAWLRTVAPPAVAGMNNLRSSGR